MASASSALGGDEQHCAVGAVLGFVQQVGRGKASIGGVVGDDDALGRPEDHHRGHAVALHLHLCTRDRRTAGADDLAHLRDGLRAEPECGDPCWAVDAKHVGDAELAAHDQHGRVDAAAAIGHRRHHQRQRGHTRNGGGHGQLVRNAGVAGLAAGHEQTGTGDGRDLLAHGQARLALEAPVGGPLHQLLVERAQVHDGVVDGRIDLGAHLRGGEFVVGGAQLVRFQIDVVEVVQRPAHGLVAVLAHVVDDAPDGRLQVGVENGREPALAQQPPCRLVHGRPGHPPHHRHAR